MDDVILKVIVGLQPWFLIKDQSCPSSCSVTQKTINNIVHTAESSSGCT